MQIKLVMKMVTPMFMHGADKCIAELRAPALKGALRFWWRAQAQEDNINNLLKKESDIFGGVSPARKSAFSIRIETPQQVPVTTQPMEAHMIPVQARGRQFRINILDYIAYGEREFPRVDYYRERINVVENINVFVNIFKEEYINDILNSFGLLSRFGCLGGKARNGYGSVQFYRDGEELPCELNINRNGSLPEYTRFSESVLLWKTRRRYNNWHDALAVLANLYRNTRLELEKRHNVSQRSFLGCPINRAHERPGSFNGATIGRRGKPYFFKVRRENNGYQGQILYLPAKFCEDKNCWERAIGVWNTVNERFQQSGILENVAI